MPTRSTKQKEIHPCDPSKKHECIIPDARYSKNYFFLMLVGITLYMVLLVRVSEIAVRVAYKGEKDE